MATPGDTLRYRIRIENLVADPVPNFTLRDELGRLNTRRSTRRHAESRDRAGRRRCEQHESVGRRAQLGPRRHPQPEPGRPQLVHRRRVRSADWRRCCRTRATSRTRRRSTSNSLEVARSDDPNINATRRIRWCSATKTRRACRSRRRRGSACSRLHVPGCEHDAAARRRAGCVTRSRSRTSVPTTRPMCRSATRSRRTRPTLPAARRSTARSWPTARRALTPLVDGIAVYAPEDTTPGAMRADATSTPSNVATITFDVTTYPDLLDGTVISNQAFVSAVDFGIVDYPSDDPRTPIVNDPTRDVVGNAPLLFATKQAVLLVDHELAGHRRSGRHAALHDHDLQQRRDPRDQRAAERQRSAEHDLRRELDAAERPAVRSAGQRRLRRSSAVCMSARPISRRRCRRQARARCRRTRARSLRSICA